jgi:hypothetical protein
MRNHGLAAANLQNTTAVRDPQGPFQDEREFFEIGRLSWLDPARWTLEQSNAHLLVPGTNPADVFVDPNRLIRDCFQAGC